jgi:hypothetical protein
MIIILMGYDHNVQIDPINKPFSFVDFCDDMLFSIFSFLNIDDLINMSRIYKPLKHKKNKWIWKEFAIRDAMTVFDRNIPTIQNALNTYLTNDTQCNGKHCNVIMYHNILDLIDRCKLNYIYGRPSVLPADVQIDLYSSNISIDRILDMIIGVDPKYKYLNFSNINESSYSGQLVDIKKIAHFVIRSLMRTDQPSVCIALLYNKLKYCNESDPHKRKIFNHLIKSISELLTTNLHLLNRTIDDLKSLKNHNKRLRMDTDCIVQEKNRRV